ncbi:MAG: GIY-YIG nuclease family protein [Candidatus Kerfeldbacteria bacterium]|nr:GIY-YIG nuclease family protein [Candidatus Kerfeldbacteria bacterium]
MRTYYIYIVSNKLRTTFYVGVTNDLERRMFEHRFSLIEGFTKHYHLKYLVYYEEFGDISDAIAREKQLKRWHRAWKLTLIRKTNPDLGDLAEGWFEGRLRF